LSFVYFDFPVVLVCAMIPRLESGSGVDVYRCGWEINCGKCCNLCGSH